MDKKIILPFLIFIALFSFCFTGCSMEGDKTQEATISVDLKKSNDNILSTADNEKDVNSNEYVDINKFTKYNIVKDVYSRITTSLYISDVKQDIGISTLRKVENSYYSVHPLKDEKGSLFYGFIMYKESGKVIDGWCTEELLTVEDFSALELGSSISSVNKIDPYNCFLENISDNTATSYHKLADGKEYVIDYKRDDNNSGYKISYARQKDDPSNFTNIMLLNDLNLITK